MEYKQMGNHYVMRVDPGEEILEKIGILCKKENIRVGSAVGLGNLWSFPFKMGNMGGFVFLLCYLFISLFNFLSADSQHLSMAVIKFLVIFMKRRITALAYIIYNRSYTIS